MFKCFKLPDTPIEIEDDGLRLRRNEVIRIGRGETNPEGFRIRAYENPGVTAMAVAIKRERDLIREANIRQFEDL